MRLAFCGLGSMGTAFAGRALDQGHDVTIWNRSPGKADDLVARGARAAASPAAAARGAEAVFVIVSDDAATLEVIFGDDDGAVGGLETEAILAVISTISPRAAREIAERGPSARVLETPVLGSPAAITKGKGRFLVGGAAETFERLRPVLTDLSAEAVHCGPAGAGATMKLAANLLLVAGIAAFAEAIEIGRGQGVEMDAIRAAFDGSLVVSPAMMLRFDALLDPEHPGWFPPSLARKDVRLASELADQAGLRAAIAPAAVSLLDAVVDQDWPDFAAVIEAVRPAR